MHNYVVHYLFSVTFDFLIFMLNQCIKAFEKSPDKFALKTINDKLMKLDSQTGKNQMTRLITWQIPGPITGPITGYIFWTKTRPIFGPINGPTTGPITGPIFGPIIGLITGSITRAINFPNDAKEKMEVFKFSYHFFMKFD